MSRMEEERELRRLFQELRQRDEASAPSFREALDRPPRKVLLPRLAVATLAVFAAVALWTIFPTRRPVQEGRLRVTATISEWKSPTASLLRAPVSELLDSVPSIGEPGLPWIGEGGLETTPAPARIPVKP
jgi:hypothetical protein